MVNVNTVYKTVLLILNQQQRGYMTPDEFNKVATQVQLDIFESYFESLNQQYRVPQNDTEYADRVKNIQQKLQFFQRTGNTTFVGPEFTLIPTDIYRLGSVFYKGTELTQYSQRNELTQILLSPLTQPTEHFPIYLYEDDKLYIYPTTINDNITISYLKTPSDVVWQYGVGSLGQFEYQAPPASTAFELAPSEQTNIIMRILAYAGVIINDPTIIQVAGQAVAAEEQNAKS
jgi:hypothetical protein|tara:strand:+ start:844 stop:1536 length:693 start_codon:yes stop_codon:yes gene_type:complete